MSINFVLVLNRQGKCRLIRWFRNIYTEVEKAKIVSDIHRLISSRDSKHQSNFTEYQNQKVVYRRYAGLYLVTSIDLEDNELSYLESLHFLVEILDVYFDQVCELDLVFNFYKLYTILDEVYLGGEIQEILKKKILNRLLVLDKLE